MYSPEPGGQAANPGRRPGSASAEKITHGLPIADQAILLDVLVESGQLHLGVEDIPHIMGMEPDVPIELNYRLRPRFLIKANARRRVSTIIDAAIRSDRIML